MSSESGQANKITILAGENFSGRTEELLKRSGLSSNGVDRHRGGTTAQYLGPDTSNYISGLAHTMREELQLFGGRNWREIGGLREMLALLQLESILEQNPMSLSGGQQALLTLVTSLAREPEELNIDCSLEQLDQKTRDACIQLLEDSELAARKTHIADNRLDEIWDNRFKVKHVPARNGQRKRQKPVLSSSHYVPYESRSVQICADEIEFSYAREDPVINGLSLELNPGQIYVLYGPNGVGKTTLAKLLAGIYPVSSGAFRLNNKASDLTKSPASTCAYHFQNPDLQLFSTTVAVEIASSALNREDLPLEATLRAFGLTRCKHEHPMDLPFTLRKRLGLAVTFAMERPWMILDEPTLGQDDETADQIAAMIRLQSRMGTGIIVITHSTRLTDQLNGTLIELEPTRH